MSAPSDPVDSKQVLRQAARERRGQLDNEIRLNAAGLIAGAGLKLMQQLGARTIAGYHPISSELDVLPLLNALHEAGYDLALPVTPKKKGPLVFRRWLPSDQLKAARFGILEPLEQSPDVAPDAILIPMLAFNSLGHRLGYGGGYYDMTLCSLRARAKVAAIGVAFDEQEMDALHDEDHDEALDWLLTPSKVRQFRK